MRPRPGTRSARPGGAGAFWAPELRVAPSGVTGGCGSMGERRGVFRRGTPVTAAARVAGLLLLVISTGAGPEGRRSGDISPARTRFLRSLRSVEMTGGGCGAAAACRLAQWRRCGRNDRNEAGAGQTAQRPSPPPGFAAAAEKLVAGRARPTAVRFGWAGPGARRRCRRIAGASAGSGHGLRHALTCLACPPLVTPDLFRGPGLPRTPIRGLPRTPIRRPQAPPPPGFPGPRNKSGVTTGGRRRSRPLR